MLSKLIRNAVCATAAVVVTSGIAFSALYAYKEFVTIAADVQKNEQIEAIMVVPVTQEPILKEEPVIIVAPTETPGETSALPQVLERIEITALREEAVAQNAATEVLERVAEYALPAANAAEQETSIPQETIDQIGKDLGQLYQAVREAENKLREAGIAEEVKTTPSTPGVETKQVAATVLLQPYLFEEYKLGVNSPSAVLKLRSKKFGDYRKQRSIDEFIRDVCAYSPDVMRQIQGKGCTIASLSKLAKGTVVRIPAAEVFVGVPPGAEVPMSIALVPKTSEPTGSVLIPTFDVPDPARTAASDAFALSGENAELRASRVTNSAYLWILGCTTALFFFGMLLVAAKNHKLETEKLKLHDDYIELGKELSDLKDFVRKAPARVRVPDGEPMTPNSPEWDRPIGIRPTGALPPSSPDSKDL